MASDAASKKLPYQMPIIASITGMFFSKGSLLKCMSIAWAPSRSCSKFLKPIVQAIDRPMEDHNEYRPPTQSQKANIFSEAMPKDVTAFVLVDRATKCLATSPFSPDFSKNHCLALSALVMVSWVVNVLEAMINRVVSGSILLSVSAKWVPSTLETK